MDRQELLGTLAAAWKRQLVSYSDDSEPVYCVYADEALTGFAAILDPPLIGKFRDEQCVLISLPRWLFLKFHAEGTATPFRIVAVGKKIIVGAWRPMTGMKYAARNTEHGCMIHIPITEFKEL